ncbi:hypothetical protein [Chitinophaga alhagiae]|uniref:hypothetical protein n=1 Tax=Chitinophaga alhagiae TaxID=2203219 RepID=UPI000E5BCF20|nr:hypothetical protein [Chitinophaga alhagiae]
MKIITKTIAGIFGIMCLLAGMPTQAQPRKFTELYNCGSYKSFSLRLVNFNEKGEKHFIANDDDMEISFMHNGEKVTIPGKGESRAFNGKANTVFDNCVIYLDGFPVENYNRYITFYNEYNGKLSQLEKSHDFSQGMYGMPNTRDPENLAKGVQIAKRLLVQFGEIEKEIQSQLNRKNVSGNFDHWNYLEKLKARCASDIKTCQRVINDNETAINNSKRETGENRKQEAASAAPVTQNNINITGNGASSPGREEGDRLQPASQFSGGLNDVKEGEYFRDDKGNYYQKVRDGARQVDKVTYDRQAANKIYANMQRQEALRQQRDAEFKQKWEQVSTSFYAMSAARHNMRDAADLDGHFETVEELNAVFAQKMREVSSLASEMQQSSAQAARAYSQAIGTSASGYDYSGMTSAIGGLASAIASSKAEKDARAELQRQRAAQEAAIKDRQLKALVTIRREVNKIFADGGMPLSSHKVTAPVLYLFAYSSNKADWNKNQQVALSVSNVIPVYRYSDGTYPYTSTVKRTFEQAGLRNPVIIGYFTGRPEAEQYRNSLLGVAPGARFVLKDITITVKEPAANANAAVSPGPDFWGTNNTGSQTGTDFWAVPAKENNINGTKTEPDFWNKK